MEQEKVTIPVETLNKVLGILGSLPYQQVAGVVAEVQQQVQPIEKPDLKAVEG